MPVGRLVRQVADKHQVCTQRSWKRPYGVGLLVAGYDASGAHLYNTCPSGNLYEYKAMAIGARAQVSGRARVCVSVCVRVCLCLRCSVAEDYVQPGVAACVYDLAEKGHMARFPVL